MASRISGVHVLTFEEGRVRLHLWFDDVGAALSQMSATVDAWFLDGFAPSKNPSMWGDSVLNQSRLCRLWGLVLRPLPLPDMCAERLNLSGFQLPGVPAMVGNATVSLHISKTLRIKNHRTRHGLHVPRAMRRGARIAVIGAGIAGCCVAFFFTACGFRANSH